MRTLRLILAYDGSRYHGWQAQPDKPTIQGALEAALQSFVGERVVAYASGRTDAGVHAIGQVISLETTARMPANAFRLGLKTYLPEDIVVREVYEAPSGFHAQFDAIGKTYRYLIYNHAVDLPFLRPYTFWHRAPLDVGAMQAATNELIGEHDFRSFETNWPNKASSVRTITAATWTVEPVWNLWSAKAEVPVAAGDERMLCFEISANGFLYNMVRSIVGTMIHVGRGKWSAADVRAILQAGDRRLAGETAPATGLYLKSVDYPPTWIRPDRTVRPSSAVLGDGGAELDE